MYVSINDYEQICLSPGNYPCEIESGRSFRGWGRPRRIGRPHLRACVFKQYSRPITFYYLEASGASGGNVMVT